MTIEVLPSESPRWPCDSSSAFTMRSPIGSTTFCSCLRSVCTIEMKVLIEWFGSSITYLDCIVLLVFLVSRQDHFSEGPATNVLDEGEVLTEGGESIFLRSL